MLVAQIGSIRNTSFTSSTSVRVDKCHLLTRAGSMGNFGSLIAALSKILQWKDIRHTWIIIFTPLISMEFVTRGPPASTLSTPQRKPIERKRFKPYGPRASITMRQLDRVIQSWACSKPVTFVILLEMARRDSTRLFLYSYYYHKENL